uniref:Uncharacterized protein n=1 Tax=Solanum lycopersicum TaxID=4081 RepID=K4CNJ4_SOLLC
MAKTSIHSTPSASAKSIDNIVVQGGVNTGNALLVQLIWV